MKSAGFVRIILVGAVYAIVGIGFGELANLPSSDQARFMWRLGAFVASAAVYGAHIWYETFRLNNSPRQHLQCRVGRWRWRFLLAAAALAHALTVSTHAPFACTSSHSWCGR